MATSTIERETQRSEAAYQKDIVQLQKIVGNENLADFGIENTDATILIAPQLFPTQYYEGLAWYDYLSESVVAINAALQTRFQSIMQTDFEILSDGNEETDNQMIELIENCFYKYMNFETLIRNGLIALTHGYSVSELIWDYKDNYFVPIDFNYRHQSHFQWFPDGLHWMDNTDKMGDPQGVNLSKEMDKFFIHQHLATDENRYGKSIIGQRGLWLAKIRQSLIKQYIRYCENHGLPYTTYKLPLDMWTDTEKAKVEAFDDENKKKKRVIAREGMEVDTVSVESGNAQIFKEMIDYCDSQYALAILGQSTTSSDAEGGSYAKSKVAKEISSIIIRADCKELETTVNGLIKTIIDFNYPAVENYPYIKYKTDEAIDTTIFIANIEKAVNMGVEVGVNYVREIMGIPEPAEDEQVLSKAQSQTSGFPFQLPDMNDNQPDIEQEPIQDDIEQSPNLPFKKKRTKIEPTETLLYFNAESEAKATSDKIYKWETTGIKNVANSIQPWLNEIISKVEKIKDPEKLLTIKPSAEVHKNIEEEYFKYFVFIYLFGQDKARKAVAQAVEMSEDIQKDLLLFEVNPSYRDPTRVLPFNEAIQFFKDKVPMTPEELENMIESLRYKAFWMSRYNTWDALNQVYLKLNQALQEGTFPQRWIEQNAMIFQRLGFDVDNPYYLENVFRTNVMTAYSAGQYKQMTDPYVKEQMPIWVFVGVEDARQSDVCAMMSGKIARADDPIWDTYFPLNHYQCRSSVRALSERQARREGFTIPRGDIRPPTLNGEQVRPIAGFDRNTAADWVNTLPDNKANMPDGWLTQ